MFVASTTERNLNEVIFRGRKLKVNCAKHLRIDAKSIHIRNTLVASTSLNHATSDSRSFVDVARRKTKNDATPTITLSSIHEVETWTSCLVLVREAKNFETFCNFLSLLDLEGVDVVESKYLGSMKIVIKFESDGAAQVFMENKSIWLKWFNRAEHIGKKLVRFERIVWVKITGIPLQSWDESNFEVVSCIFGKVLVNTSPFWNRNDVSLWKTLYSN
ncbi:unnamed protein product [Lactuca virosa]|uniref:DUF4283 domain-containing protein n=1 Tax=Lactuca virosa TaxID=75947 RepID=A0AAU9PLF0_9ASTR|nr:unnamed protein product [Lactuca virosa]